MNIVVVIDWVHLCVFVTWGKKQLILRVLLTYLCNTAVRNQKVQGHTCYLTKIFLQGLNHLTVTVSGLVECFGMGL